MKSPVRQKLAALLSAYFALGVSPPLPTLPAAIQANGNIPDYGSLVANQTADILAQIAGTSAPFATSASATSTLTALQNLFQRYTNGGAVTVTIDYAYNVVAQLLSPFIGQTFPFAILTNASTTIATPTLSDTAVTLSGTTSLVAASIRWFQGQVTQIVSTTGSAVTAGTTFSSLAQVGTGNGYTVTLSGNSISPVVGALFYLNVTAGTLPAGFYPVVKVTSATSFIIAAPIAGTAWTVTAATVPGTVTVLPSQYTPGLAGVYSPLITLTGMGSTVTNTTAV